jgi:hypothetical protein
MLIHVRSAFDSLPGEVIRVFRGEKIVERNLNLLVLTRVGSSLTKLMASCFFIGILDCRVSRIALMTAKVGVGNAANA